MPKQKTHKGTKKRFRLTASGKAKHRQAGTSHLASRKVAEDAPQPARHAGREQDGAEADHAGLGGT